MKPRQLDIFTDALKQPAAGLPLFSNTPGRARLHVFDPKPVEYQPHLFGRVTLEELQEARAASRRTKNHGSRNNQPRQN